MALKLIEAPAVLAVDESAVWDHLRLILLENGESPPELAPTDRLHVLRLMQAAVSAIDGRDGLLGRALITQTWALCLDCFPDVIEVPLPPCQEVESITYLDSNGAEQTLPDSLYRVTGVGGADKAQIRPAPGHSWPATQSVAEAVTVTFLAGYGDTPADVPPVIIGALLEMIATRYAHRESVAAGFSFSTLPASAMAALDNYRVWSF